MHVPPNIQWSFASPRICSHGATKIAARIIVAIMCLGSAYVFAACEEEAARLCSSTGARCLEDAAKSVEQAISDCHTPEGRKQHASLWQATPQFFDGQPQEHVFWRCVSRLCEAPQQASK